MSHRDFPIPQKYLGDQVNEYLATQGIALAPPPLRKFDITVKIDGEKVEIDDNTYSLGYLIVPLAIIGFCILMFIWKMKWWRWWE